MDTNYEQSQEETPDFYQDSSDSQFEDLGELDQEDLQSFQEDQEADL